MIVQGECAFFDSTVRSNTEIGEIKAQVKLVNTKLICCVNLRHQTTVLDTRLRTSEENLVELANDSFLFIYILSFHCIRKQCILKIYTVRPDYNRPRLGRFKVNCLKIYILV